MREIKWRERKRERKMNNLWWKFFGWRECVCREYSVFFFIFFLIFTWKIVFTTLTNNKRKVEYTPLYTHSQDVLSIFTTACFNTNILGTRSQNSIWFEWKLLDGGAHIENVSTNNNNKQPPTLNEVKVISSPDFRSKSDRYLIWRWVHKVDIDVYNK